MIRKLIVAVQAFLFYFLQLILTTDLVPGAVHRGT